MNRLHLVAEFLELRRNTALLLAARVLAGSGEKLRPELGHLSLEARGAG
jgi:hypothetical protein